MQRLGGGNRLKVLLNIKQRLQQGLNIEQRLQPSRKGKHSYLRSSRSVNTKSKLRNKNKVQ